MKQYINKQTHIPYLDCLRMISCILIVCVHVCASHIADFPVNSASFYVALSFDCLGLIGVPLFVMISGALTLRPGYQFRLKDILIRKTVHFFLLYYIWKAGYQLFSLIHQGSPITVSAIKNDVILALIRKTGYYHLWFLPMLALLYMFLPVIKKGLENDRNLCRYFLCVFFITALFFPTVFHFEFKFKYLFVDFFTQNDFYLFSGYIGYFVLGHYLHTFGNSMNFRKRMVIYLLGIASLFIACIIGIRTSIADQKPSFIMNTPFAATSFFMAAAVFTACRSFFLRLSERSNKTVLEKFSRLLMPCAGTTLGIYLLHPLILELLNDLGLNTLLFTPFLSIPVITIGIVILCAAVTYLLLKIPVLRRLVS